MRRALCGLLILLVAGCAGPAPTDSDPAATGPGPTQGTAGEEPRISAGPTADEGGNLSMVDASADLLLHRISLHRGTAIGFGLPGDHNCVWMERKAVPRADLLRVTATWTAVSPAWERLELTIEHEEQTGTDMVAGTSPLTLELHDVTADSFFEGFGAIVQPEIPGPVLDQPVRVDFHVEGSGLRQPSMDPGGCTWGRLV